MKVSPPAKDATVKDAALNERALRQHIRSLQIGELVTSRGISSGALGMHYDIDTTRGRYLLRLLEGRLPADARFEEALLAFLEARAFPVAKPLKGATTIAVSKTTELTAFHPMPGRTLATFEVTPHHTYQIGAFLGSLHLATRNFRRVRRNRATPANIARILERLLKKTLPAEIDRDARTLGLELVRHLTQRRFPRGIVHGDLFVDHARFERGELRAVLGFGQAASGPLAWDLAVALCDWSFVQDVWMPERAASMVAGYESVRALDATERGGLFDLVRFAATRCAVTHMSVFEVSSRKPPTRYRDYRHFMRRLDAMRSLGAQQFRDKILGRTGRQR
jgi:homoserine kinase type II